MAKSEAVSAPPTYYESPSALLERLGVASPDDIQLEPIAQTCGATILYEPLKGSDARIIGYGDRAFITVNNQMGVPRQRFSAAHELGHWMWDRGKMAFACGENALEGEVSQDDAEKRANRYAVDLLMPREMFLREMRGLKRSFKSVERLARVFQTSVTATAIRFAEFSSVPMVLVCHQAHGRRWFYRSLSVPRELKPRESVHPRTAAFSLLRNEITPVGATEVDAERWFEHEQAAHHFIHEDSVRLGPDQVLTLLWWDNLLH